MASEYENVPYDGDPDKFDLIAGELRELIDDPYLVAIHQKARHCQELLGQPGYEDTQLTRKRFIDYLDAQWRYMHAPIEISGTLQVADPETGEIHPRQCVSERVVSYGFMFFADKRAESEDTSPRVGHAVDVLDQATGRPIPAIICLDDLIQLTLPYPSLEAREAQFAYYFPEKADEIDTAAFEAPRDDQALIGLHDFFLDVDFEDPQSIERCRDATAYLRRRIELEKLASYRVSVKGDVMVMDDNGLPHPTRLTRPLIRMMNISALHMAPADLTASLSGTQRMIPFIEVTSFEKERNQSMLIPCKSILWLHSVRYDGVR